MIKEWLRRRRELRLFKRLFKQLSPAERGMFLEKILKGGKHDKR